MKAKRRMTGHNPKRRRLLLPGLLSVLLGSSLAAFASGKPYSLSARGAPITSYTVYSSTDVTTPMSSWVLVGATTSDLGGVISFSHYAATGSQRFYRFGQ